MNTQAKQTISNTIRTALSQGLNTEQVLEVVKANHPNSNTSAACVAYYRSKMKKEGKVVEVAPKVEAAKVEVVKVDNFKAVVDFMNANIQLLGNLWCRWQDEKEYEDISEYGDCIAKKFPADAGWKVVKTTKRPFGVVIGIAGEEFHLAVTAQRVYVKKVK